MSENKIVYCPNCGVQNDASHPYCYNCGTPLYETVQVKDSIDGFSLAGMIVGIISIFSFALIVPEVVGLVLSIFGYRKTYKGSKNRTFALIGIITSSISLALFFLIIILLACIWSGIAYY